MAAKNLKSPRRIILSLALKYNYEKRHALMVEATALKLFDFLRTRSDLGDRDRSLLSHAALLHDIGNFISDKSHHAHSKYLIEKDKSLSSYDAGSRHLLSLIAYNHRKKLHKDTLLLPLGEKEVVLKLSAILRVADALDSSRDGLPVRQIEETAAGLFISLDGPPPEILIARLLKKKSLFCDVFGMDVQIKR